MPLICRKNRRFRTYVVRFVDSVQRSPAPATAPRKHRDGADPEEVHQRSPATRSYDQAQARKLFEDVGFSSVSIYSEFSFEPVKADDTLFSVVAQKMDRP